MTQQSPLRYLLPIFLFITLQSFSQRKLLILGSSTSACWGVSNANNCYVNRLVSYYQTSSPISLDNRAVGGWNIYRSMPEGYIPPPNRDTPRDYWNITDAVAAKPDAIIINYPSNGYDVFTVAETMNCFRMIRQTAASAGINCFITTTQPRDNFNPEQRERLRILKDSILFEFGPYAIDFWTDITDSETNTIKQEYRIPGDSVHVNDSAHERLFQRVVAKNIFDPVEVQGALPLKFTLFKGDMHNGRVILYWKVTEVLNVSHFTIQKSSGNGFNSIGSVRYYNGRDMYTFTDEYTASGNNSYRIVAVDLDKKQQHSRIVNIIKSNRGLVQVIWAKNENVVRINTDISERVTLEIMNSAGQVIYSHALPPNKGMNTIPVYMRALNTVYFLSVRGKKWKATTAVSFVN